MVEAGFFKLPQMRRYTQRYTTLAGLGAERDTIAWYWRIVAVVASLLILGGFLTLPATFDGNAQLRVNLSFLGSFSVALLTAGFCLTGLLCFAVRNWYFRADAVLAPAFASCAIGLLTVFYSFLISSRYVWNTPALLTTIAGALSTLIYGGFLLWTYRRINSIRTLNTAHIPLRHPSYSSTAPNDTFYNNYIANMYPSSRNAPQSTADGSAPSPPEGFPADVALTEEELQRQQMLMLLLNKPSDRENYPDQTQNNFNRIDWHSAEDGVASPAYERSPPYNGYYAPAPAAPQQPQMQMQMQQAYHPLAQQDQTQGAPVAYGEQGQPRWDGIWRGGVVPPQDRLHPALRDARVLARSPSREARRRAIENS